MRITLSIDDEIYEQARRLAFESSRTIGAVVNDLLSAGLQEQRAPASKRQLGQLRGAIVLADDFDHTSGALVDAFEADL